MDLLLLSSLASCTFTFMAMASAAAVVYYLIPYWRVRSVPGPPTTPFLGHLRLLAKHGPDVFSILANKYGPIYRFHLGRQPLVIVADPELCREVGIKRFKSIGNRSLPSPISGSPLHQKGLFFTRDSKWASMRNTIVSLYQPSHLASLVPTMQFYITSAFSNLCTTTEQEPQEVTFNHITLKLTTDVIGQSAFGVDFGLSKPGDSKHVRDNEASAFIKEHMYATTSLKMDLTGSFSIILGLLFPILQEPFRQLLKRIPGMADWKIEQTNQNLTARIGDIVAKRACNRDRNAKDFLSAIIGARESSKSALDLFTSDYISALTYEHLLAGSATTSFTLSSVLYLVSKHPRVEEKLLLEIDSFGPLDLNPNADDLNNKFPYLDQVIKESMRYYTVSPLVARETSQKVQVGDYVLPKGTWIWLAIGVLAKDPKNFPRPHEFHPERFDPNCEEEKARHPYAHIPFGIGPRACIGQKFALLEIKLALIHLYRRYRFKHSPNMEFPLEFEFGIVLNFKNGVKLHVTERTT